MNKVIVEFLGTMFLSFVVFATGNYLAIGAALAMAVLVGGAISGGAFNPAIAIAMAYKGALDANMVLPYVIAQILGAIVGAYLAR